MKNLIIFGLGNMGKAIFFGIKTSNLKEIRLTGFDIDKEKLKNVTGIDEIDIEKELSLNDYIILAIKPQDVEDFLKTYGNYVDKEDKILISIVAGLKLDYYRKFLKLTKIVRVMPNTPFMVGYGASGIYFDGNFSEEEKRFIKTIFECRGIVEEVKKEKLLDAVTGLSGSGPAYVFTFISSLIDGGVTAGLPRNIAKNLAIQTVLGASILAKQEDLHPEQLKDMVTSPGGTTVTGLLELEKNAFRATIINAVIKASEKAKELGEK